MNNHVKSKKKSPLESDEVSISFKVKEKEISFERDTGKETRKLTYRDDDCIGCGTCNKACPVNAISAGPSGVIIKDLAKAPHILISPEKCTLCGICSCVCLFNAIDVTAGGKDVKDMPDYPGYKKGFTFEYEKCMPKDGELCKDCEVACHRGAIKAKMQGKKNTIERDENLCIYCSSCEKSCPEDAITVKKIFDGKIEVNLDDCQGCGLCVDICPSGSIIHPRPKKPGERPDKIEIDTDICAFCGACEFVCPVDAIKIKRKKMNFKKSKGKSWTKVWERAFFDPLIKEEAEN